MDVAGLRHGSEEGQSESLGGTGTWDHIAFPSPEAARAAVPRTEMATPGWVEAAALAQQLRLSPLPRAQGVAMGVAEPPDSRGR